MSIFDLTLSPYQIEFVLKPNITIIQAYDVVNNSDQDIILNTEVLPFLPQGNNGSVTYANISTNPNISFSLANSDLILGQPFTLAPNAKQQLVLKIKTSPEAKLADYYSTFFIYQNPSPADIELNSTQSLGKIGSHILLSVSNSENPKVDAVIQKFTITPKIKDVFFTPLKFSGQVKNNTNYFFKTSGKITITKNSQMVKELTLDPNNVLANYYRRLSCQDQDICTLSPPLWPGKYVATLSFDDSLNISPISTSFFVLPLSPIIFLLSITLIIVFITKIKKSKSLL
jgi:hypothetical protein